MRSISASILTADFSDLLSGVKKIEIGGAKYLHMDVMDGHFVPNISFGSAVMKSLLNKTNLPFDVHLMIDDPAKFAGDFVTDNTEYVTIHHEAVARGTGTRDAGKIINTIKALGAKAGISINPKTPVRDILDILGDVDLVLVMSVNPGFGGQKFMPGALDKVRELHEHRQKKGYQYKIEIDGGVNLNNIDSVITAGTDIVVVGSELFKGDDITKTTEKFVNEIERDN